MPLRKIPPVFTKAFFLGQGRLIIAKGLGEDEWE